MKLHSASPALQAFTHLYICERMAVCGCIQCQETDFLYFAEKNDALALTLIPELSSYRELLPRTQKAGQMAALPEFY